jgi:hypothetical protein
MSQPVLMYGQITMGEAAQRGLTGEAGEAADGQPVLVDHASRVWWRDPALMPVPAWPAGWQARVPPGA